MEYQELNAVVILNAALKHLQRDLQSNRVNSDQMGGTPGEVCEYIDELIINPCTRNTASNYIGLARSCESLTSTLKHPQIVLLSGLMNSMLRLTKQASMDQSLNYTNVVQLTDNIRQINRVMLHRYLAEAKDINALPI